MTSQIKIGDAKNSDLTSAIKYIIALLGVAKEKMPSSTEMLLILTYMRMHMKNVLVDEIRIAFDLAVAGKLKHTTKKGNPPLDLDLYGNTLSMKYVADVLNAYLEYKKPIIKQISSKEDQMNNYDRVEAVVKILSQKPEGVELLNKIGVEKPKSTPPIWRPPYWDIHQKWFRQFDRLTNDPRFVVPDTNCRFIKRYGEIIDVHRFFEIKVEQLQLAKDRNDNKGKDKQKDIGWDVL